MVVDSANVRDIRRKIFQTTSHGLAGGARIEGVRRHPDLLYETSVLVFEIDIGNAIAAARERRSVPMIHCEQSSFVAARVQPVDQIEEIDLRAAKRIIVFV